MVGTGILKAYFPDAAGKVMPGCFLRDHFGLRCPTCGSGTALMLLAAGHFWQAIQASWFAVTLLASLLAFDLYLIVTFVVRRRFRLELTRRDSIMLGAAGLLALGMGWVQQLLIRP